MNSIRRLISLSQGSGKLQLQLMCFFQQELNNEQQQQLGTILSRHFTKYTDIVLQLHPLIDSSNLSRLREMYNVKEEIPSALLASHLVEHEYELDDIERMYSFNLWKRREYLLHLLALSDNKKMERYQQNWKRAIQINQDLVLEYMDFNEKLSSLTVHLRKVLNYR